MSSEVRVERPGTLSLNIPKQKPRVTFKNTNDKPSGSKDHAHNFHPYRRCKSDDFRPRRKRSSSCSFSWDRKKQSQIVLPTKFLLGGNIGDPLNLEALKEEEESKNSASYGNNGRGGGAVRVIIPPNINDPLNLDVSSEDGEEQLADAIYRQRRRRKTKKRKRRNSEPDRVEQPSSHPEEKKRLSLPSAQELELKADSLHKEEPSAPSVLRQQSCPASLPEKHKDIQATPQSSRTITNKKGRSKAEDKIVSPVIPQPGVERKKHHTPHHRHPPDKPIRMNQQIAKPPVKFNPKHQQFRYGNYNQYYGYRNPDHSFDPRLKYMKREWFENKTVLDIGCNIGHISLCIARDYGPSKVVGIDIDKKLIKIAQKNIRYYLQENFPTDNPFPKSMNLLYGSLHGPLNMEAKRHFPHNVSFSHGNYVLEDDNLLPTIRPEFDVILCLSVTKWVHLNFGDEGLKRFFKRTFSNLRPGGMLILEPQGWPSYTKRRKLTAEIFENYRAIRLFPDKFGEYLLKEVGFAKEEKIFVHDHFARGFRRPIFVYRKCEEASPLQNSDGANVQQTPKTSDSHPPKQKNTKVHPALTQQGGKSKTDMKVQKDTEQLTQTFNVSNCETLSQSQGIMESHQQKTELDGTKQQTLMATEVKCQILEKNPKTQPHSHNTSKTLSQTQKTSKTHLQTHAFSETQILAQGSFHSGSQIERASKNSLNLENSIFDCHINPKDSSIHLETEFSSKLGDGKNLYSREIDKCSSELKDESLHVKRSHSDARSCKRTVSSLKEELCHSPPSKMSKID